MTGGDVQHQRFADGMRADVLIRPRRALVTQLGLAVLALVVPLGAVLLALSIPSGHADAVLLGLAAILVLGALLTVLYLGSSVRVSEAGEIASRFLGRRVVVPAGAVSDLLVLHVYQGLTLDTQPRLAALDPAGRVLLRLSGHSYGIAEMSSLAAALDLPLTERAGVLTQAALREQHRDILPWFERSRMLLAVALAAAGIAAAALVYGFLVLTGVPVSLRL